MHCINSKPKSMKAKKGKKKGTTKKGYNGSKKKKGY